MLIAEINFASPFIEANKSSEMSFHLEHYMTMALNWFRVETYPIFLANSTSILKVARPRQSQGSHFKVPVGEHVSQTELVVVFFCKMRNGTKKTKG
jgi:hypothetical protein